MTEATKGPSLLIIDEIDAFFATNPHSAKRIVDLITKKPIIATSTSSRGGKDQAESSKNDDESEDVKDDHPDYTNTMNPNSQNQTNRPNPQSMSHQNIACKRPVIFLCEDPYSKGIRLLKNICHHFRLEKNLAALEDRLKLICNQEVISFLSLETIDRFRRYSSDCCRV